jgi:hypothetical protein
MRNVTIGLVLAIATAITTQSAAWSFEFTVPTHPTLSEVTGGDQKQSTTPEIIQPHTPTQSIQSDTTNSKTNLTVTESKPLAVRHFKVPTRPTLSEVTASE